MNFRETTLGNLFDITVFVTLVILAVCLNDTQKKVAALEGAAPVAQTCSDNQLPSEINDVANGVYGLIKAMDKLNKEGE